MKCTLFFALLLAGLAAHAQDQRERLYNYEILTPNSQPKPAVEGFAKERVEERLDRGLVAARAQDGRSVYLSWRLLKTDDAATKFNVFRDGRRIASNVSATTDFVDRNPAASAEYWVETVSGKTKTASERLRVELAALPTEGADYVSIPLRGGVRTGKVALADLNGDGRLDFIVRHPDSNVDPGTQPDTTGITYKIEAYLADGTYLWTKDLGPGTEPGIWYSPFVVWDFNGDGRAEVALKTTGDDWKRDERRRVYAGSEYLSVLDGMTGAELARVAWPERSWSLGDVNRQNRNQIGMAYVDGKTPCILAMRGTYRQMLVDCWQLNGERLERLWSWDGDEENPLVRSQGAHNMVAGDVDGDGRDEILLGGAMLNPNGTLRWSAGLGHPDKAYLTDVDPARPGLEVFMAIEPWQDRSGVSLRDASTGAEIWGLKTKTFHVGDGMVADINPEVPGLECFASEDRKGGTQTKYLLAAAGELLGNDNVPPCRNWIWWDAGKTRQTFFGDDNRWGASSSSNGRAQSIGYWQGERIAEGILGDIILIADALGDWREEVITALPGELRIYHTDIPAVDRRTTLLQDPIYRSYVVQRAQGYPQAPVPGFYLGN